MMYSQLCCGCKSMLALRSMSLAFHSVPCRTFSSFVTAAPRKTRKIWLETETRVFGPINENQYYSSLFSTRLPVAPNQPAPAAVKKLEAICRCGSSLELPEYDEFVKELADELRTTSQETLGHTLQLLKCAPRHAFHSRNLNTVWSAVDSVLVKKHKKAKRTLEELSASLDWALLMYLANPFRVPEFLKNLNSSFVKRLGQLNLDKDMLLKLLFNLNVTREPIPAPVARDLEWKVLDFIDDMTIEEVGIVAAAFFKTQTKMKNVAIIMNMIEKAKDRANRTPERFIAISSIFKILKYQILPQTAAAVRDLIDSFSKDDLMQMTPIIINHLCRLATAYHKHSPLLLCSAVEILSSSMEQGNDRARFKDVVEILRVCDDFGYSPDSALINKIICRWPSPEEATQYPSYFITYLSLLASMGYYPEALIEKCFSYKFMQLAKGSEPFPYIPLLSLHAILSIDCYPKFNGSLLCPGEVDDAVRRIGRVDIGQVLDRSSRSNTFMETHMRRLFWVCKEKFGSRIVFAFILPYIKFPDIILLSKDQDAAWLKTQKLVPGAFRGSTCISLESRQHFADSQAVQRNFYRTRKRLLEKLGFNIFPIHFADLSNASDRVLALYLNKLE